MQKKREKNEMFGDIKHHAFWIVFLNEK